MTPLEEAEIVKAIIWERHEITTRDELGCPREFNAGHWCIARDGENAVAAYKGQAVCYGCAVPVADLLESERDG